MQTLDMQTVARKLFAAYNSHDAAAVARLYDADGTHEDVAQGRSQRGPEAIAAGLGRFFERFPDARWQTPFEIADAGQRVAIPYVFSGTLQKPIGAIAARGQAVSLRGVLILELNDGRIVRSTDYWDSATFQRQLNNENREETK